MILRLKQSERSTKNLLRWDLQNKVVTIPKSIKEHRIIENTYIFYFELTAEDMEKISSLNKDERVGPNPDTFEAGFTE